jgi:uncharacterized protein (DUF433 family)
MGLTGGLQMSVPQPNPDEVKFLPAYTLTSAARLIGSNPSTLRVWFRGRHPYQSTSRYQRAVKAVLPAQSGLGEPLSFMDLIMAHVIHTIRKGYGIPLKKVRAAIQYIESTKGDLLFLASKDFYLDHKDIFLEIGPHLISLSESGQVVDKEVISEGLEQLSYGSDGYAGQFFPAMNGRLQREFAINPAINFGRLSIARLGVDTNALAARFVAGEKIINIAHDYDATPDEVEDAIRWHERLAA